MMAYTLCARPGVGAAAFGTIGIPGSASRT